MNDPQTLPVTRVPTRRYVGRSYTVWLDDGARERLADLTQRLGDTLKLKVSNGVLLRVALKALQEKVVAQAQLASQAPATTGHPDGDLLSYGLLALKVDLLAAARGELRS